MVSDIIVVLRIAEHCNMLIPWIKYCQEEGKVGSKCSSADKPIHFSCQTGQVRFRIYMARMKFSCPHKCICLTISPCYVKNWASKY